jgi:hypothetical protein
METELGDSIAGVVQHTMRQLSSLFMSVQRRRIYTPFATVRRRWIHSGRSPTAVEAAGTDDRLAGQTSLSTMG